MHGSIYRVGWRAASVFFCRGCPTHPAHPWYKRSNFLILINSGWTVICILDFDSQLRWKHMWWWAVYTLLATASLGRVGITLMDAGWNILLLADFNSDDLYDHLFLAANCRWDFAELDSTCDPNVTGVEKEWCDSDEWSRQFLWNVSDVHVFWDWIFHKRLTKFFFQWFDACVSSSRKH